MSESALILSPIKYYNEAKKMLENKDIIEFVSKISIAIEAAQNDREMLAKSLFLKTKGLVNFNYHIKSLECIDEALKYNVGKEALELKKIKGLAKGFLGEVDEALRIFKELSLECNDIDILTDAYINIAWVHFTLTKNTAESIIEEVKCYLDKTEEYFNSLSNIRKWKVLNAYSVYYYFVKDYEKAIDILKNSIRFCKEEDLPDVYNNLAEFYIKMAEEEGSDVPDIAKQYLDDAEILGTKYKNNLALGYIFYTKAMLEVSDEQLFRALDTLYMSFEFFKEAEATVKACDTLLKINELMNEYKLNSLKSLRSNLKLKLKNTQYFEKI